MTSSKEYSFSKLSKKDLDQDPFAQFQKWYDAYLNNASHVAENTMVLATSSENNPTARTVLLKTVENSGFIFFSNYQSRKGKQLAANPKASLVFYWPEHERQVIVEGSVEKISEEESDAYFDARPLGSQVAAKISNQSEMIESRRALDEEYQKQLEQSEEQGIERPSDWGGYSLKPASFEFWQGRASRLNDRLKYMKQEGGQWEIVRLQP